MLDTIAQPTKKPRGRLFFANPGPTNIPETILHAIGHHAVDFHAPEFMKLYDECWDGILRIMKTNQHMFMYTGSGHAAWEAAVVNVLSAGDTVLVPETGVFSESWSGMMRDVGLKVEKLACNWREGMDIAALGATLAADTGHVIKAVCVVQNETSTGMSVPIDQIRAAMDAAGHPALLLVDTISSLGCIDLRMDEWKIDVVVGGSQKGLMLPTGMAFTGVSDKAMAASATSTLPKHYFSWKAMAARKQRSFIGTVPTNQFFGLRESIRLIDEEGLDEVFARHARLAEAVRRCVRHWSGNNGPELFCQNKTRESNSVTAVLLPDGHDADAIRQICSQRFNVSLGGGLGKLGGKVFRIGHLGDLNEPMVLGTLGAVEMALRIAGVPHRAGGVGAAMEYLASL
ncbi:MAG: aminotransferase class V-fold PLP-dependent enzyme [Acetobacteraceae bacterium]|nr:aminotransferase class V-fold PLP-dependent enzyme [Acetobacteraceae bacterium]